MALGRSIHKINLSERQDVFLISSYEPQKKLSVTLLDLDKCESFSGTVSDIELRSQAATIRMSFSTFVELTTKSLKQNEFDDLQFLYNLEENCDDFVFKWKSVDSDETIITIGVIKMHKDDYVFVLKNVFSLLAEELTVLNKRVIDLEANCENAAIEKSEAFKLIDEATALKESIEKDLYSKFVLVLNAKKRKIRDLTENGISSNDSKRVKVSNKQPIQNNRNRLHEISDSSSDEVDGQLDDINVPGPSKIKHNNSLLFLDEDEPVVSISPSKVRNRKVQIVTEAKDLSSSVKETLSKICDSHSESDEDLLNNL